MDRRRRTVFRIAASLALAWPGCAPAPATVRRSAPATEPPVRLAARHEPVEAAAAPVGPADAPAPSGPQPVDVYIRHALAENRAVRAAYFNVQALKNRVPQVTSLDDPFVSNSIFPIPSVAPQYYLMGYMPYETLLAQQFPWFGTLRLRGEAAEQDVKVALFELAAAQLDAVADVKRAYLDLNLAERVDAILKENRALAEEFLEIARERYRTATASQADVLRSEVALTDIDRETETNRLGLAEARADLARLLHADPESADLRTLPEPPAADVPAEIDRLYRLAVAARPELRGRLAAVARDEKAVELARKRYYPNLTVGVIYQDMEKTNALSPRTAGGFPNVGLFVGFNLPVYRKKLAAGVCEARSRASADAALYESERDQARRDVKALLTQAQVQRNVLELLRTSNLPRSRQMLELTAADYRTGNAGADYLTLLSAWREVLQVRLQSAQVEAELGKALASLERAVGAQLNEHPPAPGNPPPAAADAPVGPEPTTPPPPPDAKPGAAEDAAK